MSSECSANRRRPTTLVAASSITIAAVVALAYPVLPAKVYAADISYNWVRQNDKLDLNGGWYGGVASSADGSVLMSAVMDGDNNDAVSPLYISRNNGSTWQNIAENIDADASNNWLSVDVSNNGEVIVASSEYAWDYVEEEHDRTGRIYVSENGGDTWTNVTPNVTPDPDSVGWRHVVVSGDGSRIAGVSNHDYENVYISDNGGDNWTPRPVDDDWTMDSWDTLVISDNGDEILFGGESWESGMRELYYSNSNGVTWSNITPTDFDAWGYDVKAAMDASGDKLAVALYGEANGDSVEKVYMSKNDGTSWTDISPESDSTNNWGAVAMSDDGNMLSVMGSWTSNMYVSNTDGEEWDLVKPGTEFNDNTINWYSADFNADGTRFIGTGGEEVYTTDIEIPDDSEGDTQAISFGNAEDNKTVVLTLPSGTTVTCHSPVKESGLSAQDSAYSYPLGLVDFCFSGADENNPISLIFVTDLKPNQVAVRKYTPNTAAYSNLSGATVIETTYDGKHALRVSYTIVDNGPLDTDPDVGEVADPVGLGVLGVNAPNTGVNKQLSDSPQVAVLVSTALTAGLVATPIRRKLLSLITPKK